MATELNDIKVTTEKLYPQVIAALIAAGGALITGTVMGWSSQLHSPLVNHSTYNFNITYEEFTWMGSILNLGAASTCIPTAYMCDAIGRKYSMMALTAPFLLGWALVCGAIYPIMVILGRFVLGMGCGGFCVAAPMYTVEISSKNIRGLLGTFFQLMITIGILLSNILGAYFKLLVFHLTCLVLTSILVVLFIFLPETPTYYVSIGNDEKAEKSIRRLRGKHFDTTTEITGLKDEQEAIKAADIGEFQSLCQAYGLKSLFIGMGLMFFQQVSGMRAVIFYASVIFTVRLTYYSDKFL